MFSTCRILRDLCSQVHKLCSFLAFWAAHEGRKHNPADRERIAGVVRSHWEAENRFHWCLDVQFNEDQSRVRTSYASNNRAIVRHVVMNLLRLNTMRKASIKPTRMLPATIDEFRTDLLEVMTFGAIIRLLIQTGHEG